MPNKKVILFLVLSLLFLAAHYFAMQAHLYWYITWFDSVMHLWGGILLGLGVHTFCTFRSIPLAPSLGLVIITLALATGIWEIFEWYAGLFGPADYLFDTTKDIILGFSGGLLAHIVLTKRTIRS
jgi:hypothetical protein